LHGAFDRRTSQTGGQDFSVRRDQKAGGDSLHSKPGRHVAPGPFVKKLPDQPRAFFLQLLPLRYRRVNQADRWQVIEMERSGAEYRAVIAAEYTDSPFPLQYHCQIRTRSGELLTNA